MEAFIWQRHAAACPHKARHWNLDLIQQPELLMLSSMTFQVGDPTSSNRRGAGTRNDSHAWLSDLVESRRRVFFGGGSHRLSTQHHLFFLPPESGDTAKQADILQKKKIWRRFNNWPTHVSTRTQGQGNTRTREREREKQGETKSERGKRKKRQQIWKTEGEKEGRLKK